MLTYVNRYIDKHGAVMSLDEVISTTITGEELRLMDVVPVVDEADVFYHLKECLRTMSTEDQYIVEKTMQGYTQKEIGEQLGIAQSSVCRSLHKFRDILEKE
jgi:DNA-directed RNA polymerase specialized sigma subunit